MSENKKFPKWQFYRASKVYSVFAVVFLLIGSLLLTSVAFPKVKYKPVVGTVIENTHTYLAKSIMKNARIKYMNTIMYNVNGVTYTIRSNSTPFGRSPRALPVGRKVDMRYNPNIPTEAFIRNKSTDAVLVGIGLIFIMTGMCLMWAIYMRYNDIYRDKM